MNKIHRILWSKKTNGWVVASEHATSSKSKSSKGVAGKALLGALIPLVSNMAYAADECGPTTSGSYVVCDSSTSGVVSYPSMNIDMLIDGSNGAVNLSGVNLNNTQWSSTVDNNNLSLTTQGTVTINSTTQDAINIGKYQGAGDLTLSLGAGTQITQTITSDSVSNNNYFESTGIVVSNTDWSGSTSNTNIMLEEGSSIDIESATYSITGIKAQHYTSGDFSFVNNASLNITATTANSSYMRGIVIEGSKHTGTIENHGDIRLTNGGNGMGIYGVGMYANLGGLYDQGAPTDVTLINTGNIEGDYRADNGDYFVGIESNYSGVDSADDRFTVVNSGSITKVNYGINATVNGGYYYDEDTEEYIYPGMKGEVIHSGTIEAEDVGILLGGGNFEELTVRSSGKIVTGASEEAKGVYITSTSGGVVAAANVIIDVGAEIENWGTGAQSAAVAIDSTQKADVTVSGKLRSHEGAGISFVEIERQYIPIGPSGAPPFILDAGQSEFNVNLKGGSEVQGGYLSAGIASKGGNALNIVVEEGATLGALSDVAISAEETIVPEFWEYVGYDPVTWEGIYEIHPEVVIDAAPVTLSNAGEITGNFQFGNSDDTVSIESTGVWNIRNFADTDGDGERDTKSVAISDFGGGNDTIINRGTINLVAVDGATNVDTTGEYIPNGALSVSEEGVVHGQLLNVNRFENSGVIDLTGNGKAGNVFVITGGDTAGVNGGGTFVTNGGEIRMNSLLNEGGDISQSDILVLDNVELGSAPTRITIKPIEGSVGVQTVGDGIQVVDVKGTMDAGSFELTPLNYGDYGYTLTVGTDDNLYLTNYLQPITDGTGGAGGTGGFAGQPIWNVNIGSYHANQYAARDMFNQNISDRSGLTRHADDMFWARTNYKEVNSDLFSDHMDTEVKTTLLQFGADLYRSDDASTVGGVFVGYGHAEQNTHSKQTSNRASGEVNGYQIGVYGTWEPSEKPFYVDSWAYYALYKNKLSGPSLPFGESKYDGKGFGISTEVGYTFDVAQSHGRTWKVEPHAQLTYTHVKTDAVTDTMGTSYIDSKNEGLQTRVGARFYTQADQNAQGINPFVEANWLHNGGHTEVRVANSGRVYSDRIGENVGELKLGLQGSFNDKWSIWGHVGTQKGNDGFKRNEVQFGLGYVW